MIATLVHIWVKPENVTDFIKASTSNHKQSITEEGNLRFDLLQDVNDPTKFILYEAYSSEKEAAAHKDTEHYRVWRDTVAGWMAQPRRGDKYIILAPESGQS